MGNKVSRRNLLAGAAALSLFPRAGFALSTAEATTLVDRMIGEINGIINSGASESAMLRQFEGIFKRYANTTIIAYSVLGNDRRRASEQQQRAFVEVFEGYISRKYGRRFREFIGGQITVENAQPVKSWFEVRCAVRLRGQSPFRVDFLVREGGGRNRFFDMLIEGASLVRVERNEIGAMLDRRGGDIDRLIADLRNAG